MMEGDDGTDEPEVVATNMRPPPPRVPSAAGSGVLTQIKTKAIMQAWAKPENSWQWYSTAVKPVAPGLSLQRAKRFMHSTAEITSKNLGMLTDIAGIEIREFMSPGDDRFATDRLPTEHLEIFIDALIKLVSKGVTSPENKTRIGTLEQGLRSGLTTLKRHCVECRSEVRIPANSKTLVNLVNYDLNEWGAQVFDEATDFMAMFDVPPAVIMFPEVVVPRWTRLSQYIGAGGLRSSQHQPRSQSSPPVSTKGESAKRGYCYAWAKGECPRSARDCRWIHAYEPNLNHEGGGGRGRNDDVSGNNGGTNREDSNMNASDGGGRNNGGSGSGGQSGNANVGGGRGGNGGGGGRVARG
eukprot:g10413.t1